MGKCNAYMYRADLAAKSSAAGGCKLPIILGLGMCLSIQSGRSVDRRQSHETRPTTAPGVVREHQIGVGGLVQLIVTKRTGCAT